MSKIFPASKEAGRSAICTILRIGVDCESRRVVAKALKRKGRKEMKKKFKLQDLDCANCAAKMEESIQKIDGVKSASVSFMTQKMMVEADDENFDSIMEEVVRVCAKVEPDCTILM
jgi:copper chaperone CopZ